jgi:hypothetical protein
MRWWDGTDWDLCSDSGADTTGNYIWAKIRTDTTPNLDNLVGTPFTGGGSGPASSFGFEDIDDQVAGTAFEITITAYDEYDNVATGYNGTANLSDGTNTIAPVVTGNFTAGVWTGNVTITDAQVNNVITASDTEDSSMNGTSNAFTVSPAEPASIVILPDEAAITAGGNQTYTAEAYDEFGNVVADVTDETEFSIDPEAAGQWAANNYTSELAGEWTVTGNYTGLTDTATLIVNPAEAASIAISPDTATITAGESQECTAIATDEFGNVVADVTAETIFTIDEAAGGEWVSNN